MAEELRACGREARAAPATAGSEGNARAKFAIHIPRSWGEIACIASLHEGERKSTERGYQPGQYWQSEK